MLIKFDELEVVFPYDYIYPEQYAYMADLKRALDAGGHALLEMPSGTGKTIALLSLIVAYQHYHASKSGGSGAVRKLVYCSRTVPEINKALVELSRLMAYRRSVYAATNNGIDAGFLAVGVTSRKNLCINPAVVGGGAAGGCNDVAAAALSRRGKVVDAKCRNLTSTWVRNAAKSEVVKHKTFRGSAAPQQGKKQPSAATETTAAERLATGVPLCTFYEDLEDIPMGQDIPDGVYTTEDLKAYGRNRGVCPYFVARRAMARAQVVIYSFPYLLDPKVAELVSRDIGKETIVVFDEAHNIDNVCIESLSVDLTRTTIDNALRGLDLLKDRVDNLKAQNNEKLEHEYQELVNGLRERLRARDEDVFLANPALPQDVLESAVPGNIRKADSFVNFMKRFSEYLKVRMRVLNVVSETPTSFLRHLKELALIDRKPLQFCSERLVSLIRTLELTDLDEYTALQTVAYFGTLASTYDRGFRLILEPYETETSTIANPVFHLVCLDASLAIKPVFDRFSSVIITSGTLSPLNMYPRILQFTPRIIQSYSMTLSRSCFLPLIVTRGSDQVPISSKYEVRNDPAVVRNYGNILVEICRIVPDGVVAFFPSYTYMESIVSLWNDLGILKDVWQNKLIFVETPDVTETAVALEHYRAACDNGRGAVLLSVARGKVSEGIDFDHQYGRAVIMFGIPYQYTESRLLKARLEYLRTQYQVRENDFLAFDAMRHAAQCLGRVLRGKTDYGLMVLADARFQRADKRGKLPRWMQDHIADVTANLSTDMAVAIARKWLRQMAQPVGISEGLGVSLWSMDDVRTKGGGSSKWQVAGEGQETEAGGDKVVGAMA